MKLFNKIKSLLPKKKKISHKDIYKTVMDCIDSNKLNGSHPNNLTHEQWLKVLKAIEFGFKSKNQVNLLKSPARRREREQKVQRSFELLNIYFKDL